MKKILGSLVTVLLVVFINSLAFSAEQGVMKKVSPLVAQCPVEMEGKVLSIDKNTNEVVIQDSRNNTGSVIVKPEDMKKLKVGSMVRFGMYMGSNKAEAFEIIKPAEKERH